MTTTTVAGRLVHVNEEGFLTEPTEWDEQLGAALAAQIGLTMTDQHWEIVRWLRSDFEQTGQTATLRRIQTRSGVPIKQLFALFPQKPAKKLAYVAGLPKPQGCV